MMDWHAAQVSLTLAVLTAGLLLPVGLWLARWLATTHWPGRPLVEALLLLPLLLPPTVIGFYFCCCSARAVPWVLGWRNTMCAWCSACRACSWSVGW